MVLLLCSVLCCVLMSLVLCCGVCSVSFVVLIRGGVGWFCDGSGVFSFILLVCCVVLSSWVFLFSPCCVVFFGVVVS